ncbi:tRNA modification GTPase GTPBP3, mitochondrial-like [Diadema antillarum]|uniref:tRNA modification GTPase GTPBP3, mitochondrial-like n=1 Tax=Diadema antillarum TaxID=105358 RepID=UPI003A886CEB
MSALLKQPTIVRFGRSLVCRACGRHEEKAMVVARDCSSAFFLHGIAQHSANDDHLKSTLVPFRTSGNIWWLPTKGISSADYKLSSSSTTTSPHHSFQSTIFALASGHGKCGVAVVRISGPRAWYALEQVLPRKIVAKVAARQAVLSPIYDPFSQELIDNGLILWFPAPNSFTGEDVCELQVHGGPAVIAALYSALGRLDGFSLAEPGQFSKRAFYNGKLDLTEVEGLGDLIHAETEAQRRQAVRQMSGDLSKLYHRWRKTLLKVVAHVEAYIDFSEDENIEEGVLEEAKQQVSELLAEVKGHLADNRKGERLRSGVHVTIAGRPNAGKSTLLNALCQRPAAIVSPIAGTTRDVLESTLNIGGYPVIISDTAGIRDTRDEVEMEGVRRARERTSMADIVVFMVDATTINISNTKDVVAQIQAQVKESRLWDATSNAQQMQCGDSHQLDSETSHNHDWSDEGELIIVLNKTDLLDEETRKRMPVPQMEWHHADTCNDSCSEIHPERTKNGERFTVFPVSCKTEDGLNIFLEKFKERLEMMCSNTASSDPYLTQVRHRNHLSVCAQSLASFGTREDLVLAAEEIRIALRQLGKITGHVTTEEVLDIIFKDFCIGK